MRTMLLQWGVTLAFLVFAVASLRVGLHTRRTAPETSTAWILTGSAFLLQAVSLVVQLSFGTAALWRGAGSRTWDAYLAWSPAFNHSRTFHLIAFALALLLLLRRSNARSALVPGLVLIALGHLTGAGVGRMEAEYSALTHYTAVARWDVIELLLFLPLLHAALPSARIDRLLWFALSVYTFHLALSILWFAGLSRLAVPGEWAPQPWVLHALRLDLTTGLCVIAVHRLALVRAGRTVPPVIREGPKALSVLR
jgi:hypothetical protein